MQKPENRSKAVRIWALETKHARAQYSTMRVLSILSWRRTISKLTTAPTHGMSNADRRVAERALWRSGFLAAVVVHLLVFFLWWGQPEPESPFAAAGPREGDNRAASGGLQAMNIRIPPSRPLIRPQVPLLTLEPVTPIELQQDQQQQVETASILGDRPGVDGPGLPTGDGRGDGGTAESGRFGKVPPSPRGIIMPPSNRNVRGQRIEVWVFVNERGRVVADSTQLRPPTSDGDFNARILREAAEWVFEPAKEGGRAVGSWFPYTISM